MASRPGTLALLANATKGHATQWAVHFAERGWRVHVLTFDPAPLPGVDVIPLMPRAGEMKYVLAAPRVRRVLRQLRPSIVHAHYASGYGLLGRLAATRPYVLSVWGSDVFEFPGLSPLHAHVLRGNLRAADHVCSTSWAMARETRRYVAGPITVTPFGVDGMIYRPASDPVGPTSGPLIIGTVKTLEPAYGVEYLLRAFAALAARQPARPMQLVIAGDGSLRGRLELLAVALGIADRTRFLGRVAQAAVPGILRTFTVYAALSVRESFGVAVLEASACGIPVVASAVDGLPEVVEHGRSGLLVPPRDVVAATDAMERIALDAGLRERLGAGGRALVLERYEWGVTARIMERLYDAVRGDGLPPDEATYR